MKNAPDYPTSSTNHQPVWLQHGYTLALLCSLVVLFSACTANRTGAKGQPVRLKVGEIREVNLVTRADTTWQLTATSDNQEVVDVARKPTSAATGSVTAMPTSGPAAFLLKGVTIGTAQVVFSEKQPGTDGTGTIRKRYRVTVTSN
ncbi:hypothetical protein JYG30_17635 [Fibrella sp. USSR17]